MTERNFQVTRIGTVRSPLKRLDQCPRQGREGAPEAWIDIDPPYKDAMEGMTAGNEIWIMTWLHLADRSRLKVHPRGDPNNPMRGVFSTRSPHRPNPVGLHKTRVIAVETPISIRVAPLEVLDQTPVVDIKSVL